MARERHDASTNGWRDCRLGDVVELKRGYDLPQHQRRPGSIPVVSSSGFIGFHSEPMVKGPGVVTGRYGTLGQVFYITDDYWPLNTTLYVRDFKGNDPKFVSYFLKTVDFLSCSDKAAVPGINRNHLHELRVQVPPPPVQRAIAHILGTLDDKIELNRRMNETLEAMARAIFKSWFVDFDPVRAKLEGRKPRGMNGETAKLFPSALVESPLGPIPKQWRASTLGAEAQRCGGTIQTGPFGSQLHASDYVADGVPVVMPKNIDRRRVSTVSIARIREHDAQRLSRHRLRAGDIVYSRRGDVERHALIGPRETGWLCGTGCLLVRLGPRWPSPAFASFALDRPETRAWITQHAIGATMPNLNTGILADVPLLLPPDEVLSAYANAVDPLQALMVTCDEESALLAQVRAELLPQLLSGRVSCGVRG